MAQIWSVTTSEVDGEVVDRESVGAVDLEGDVGAELVERLPGRSATPRWWSTARC